MTRGKPNLNIKEIQGILESFSIKAKKISKIPGGLVNASFIIEDAKRKYVLRVYQLARKTKKAIEHEIRFMKLLCGAKLPVPKLLETKAGTELAVFKDKSGDERFAILMEYAEGRHLKFSDFDLLGEFAKIQARMHLASKKSKPIQSRESAFQTYYDWMDLEFNLALRKCRSDGVRKDLLAIYKSIHSQVRKSYREIMAAPGGDVHLDYDSDNILVAKGRIKAILDFDDLSNLPFALDIANSLWWWLVHNPKKKQADILTNYFFAYQKVRKLSERETKLISLFMRMRNLTIGALAIVKGGKSGIVRNTRVVTAMDKMVREA